MAKDSYSAGNLEMQIQAVGTDATASLSSVNSQLKTMKNLVGGTKKALSMGALLGKLYFIRNYTKQIGRGIANLVQNAIDYTETLNLWQVAMRNNRQEAEKFVSTMNKAYGISEQTLMNYQATFKNMLSALGGISEGTSYALSEYLTQMALDYASLYNTSIERAMTVFQSVLSGQVRPIRSISGYDITETTIFQLYQQMGGEKTMRQLTQTEKRLLRIYAVFQQMENSGTIGDLNKTLNETSANQLRMLNEGLKELGTWLGIIMEQYIKPILPYLNATIITLKNIIQAIAVATGYKPFEGAIDSTQELNEELDNITGKLLSFDRFEALNSSADKNILGIDTALLDGLSKYESILAGVTNEATALADKWTKWWVDDEGKLTEQAQDLLNILKGIGVILGLLIGAKILGGLGRLVGLLFSTNTTLSGLTMLTTGIIAFVNIWDDLSGWERAEKIIKAVVTALTAGAIAMYAFKQNWVKAAGVAALVAGGYLTISSAMQPKQYKTGGLVEDGIFTMNKGEMFGTFDDGSSVVANNQQIVDGIKQGVYSAVVSAMNQTGNRGGVGNVYLDGRKVGITTAQSSYKEMVRTSLVRANS